MTTGQIIKKLREERGMTQEELAKLMGYSHKSSINKIETRKSDLPQSKIIAFAKVFGVEPCEIIGYEAQKSSSEQWNEFDQKYNPDGKLFKEAKIFDLIKENFGSNAVDVLCCFMQLNEEGKKKAVENLEDLTAIEKYTIDKRDENT